MSADPRSTDARQCRLAITGLARGAG